jgi:hypothetical protein
MLKMSLAYSMACDFRHPACGVKRQAVIINFTDGSKVGFAPEYRKVGDLLCGEGLITRGLLSWAAWA